MKLLKHNPEINVCKIARGIPRIIWTESTEAQQFTSDFMFLWMKFVARTALGFDRGYHIRRYLV